MKWAGVGSVEPSHQMLMLYQLVFIYNSLQGVGVEEDLLFLYSSSRHASCTFFCFTTICHIRKILNP